MDYTEDPPVSREMQIADGLVAVRREDGSWHDRKSKQPLVGARDMTAAEFIGSRARFVSKMGQWVDVPGDVATADPDILRWCWKNSNSGSPEVGFRFERKVFEKAGNEAFPMVYLPELHDGRAEIRQLARTERLLRAAKADLAYLEKQRAIYLRAAARGGCSRRRLAAFIGISFARVQQLIAQ